MDSQMRVTGKQVQYSSYTDKAALPAKSAQEVENQTEYDVFEQEKEEESQIKRMEEQLERIRQMRFQKKKPKAKLSHNTADIRMRMLSSNSKMVVRMALSEAYREMATISTSNIGNSYDSKEVAKAMGQIKKVIAAGKLKIANLSKEERAEMSIRRARKRLEKQEIQEMKRELVEKKHQNRKKERQVSGRPQNGEKDYGVEKYIERYRSELLPDSLINAATPIQAGAGTSVEAVASSGSTAAQVGPAIVGGAASIDVGV